MYKVLNAFLLTLIFSCTIFVKIGYSQIKKQYFSKVTIEYENFATSTAENVKCGLFTIIFRESIKKIEIKDENELKSISLWYKMFTVIKLKPVDVRVIVKFYFKHYTDEYCMDRFGNFVGGKTGKMYTNEVLATFIKKQCL
jgi:hypothetical protein